MTAAIAKINPTSDPEFIDIPEGAKLLHVSHASIRRYLTQKTLTRYKVGHGAKGRTLLRRSEVLSLIRKAE